MLFFLELRHRGGGSGLLKFLDPWLGFRVYGVGQMDGFSFVQERGLGRQAFRDELKVTHRNPWPKTGLNHG